MKIDKIRKIFLISFLSSWIAWLFLSSFGSPCFSLPFVVVRQVISTDILMNRKRENDRIPELPNFQAPILQEKKRILFSSQGTELSDIREAKKIVAEDLSRLGILKTLHKIMHRLPELPYLRNGKANRALLEEIGIPVKLLSYYCKDNPKVTGLDQIVTDLLNYSGKEVEGSDNFWGNWKFTYVSSVPGFKILPENGVFKIEALRMQLSFLDYLSGPGDGCALDIVNQLLKNTFNEKFLISIKPSDLNVFSNLTREWNIYEPERIILLEDENVSSQWAQDNCKTGFICSSQGKFQQYITIVPRFANVGEEESEYRPSESFVFDQLQRAGWNVVQSSLLFQGGNLLPVKNPETGELILFLGQAEVRRNIKLGLTEKEVLSAFQQEWGVDRIEILPQLSFHIDLEVTFRWHDGRIIAFVNDSFSAARLIVKCGIQGLHSCGSLTGYEAEILLYCLEHSVYEDWMVHFLWNKINEFKDEDDSFNSEKAGLFVNSSAESGSLNLSRFLAGLVLLVTTHRNKEKFWTKLIDHYEYQYNHQDFLKYYQSYLEREKQRAQLKIQLSAMGIKVIALPSTSEKEASLNYINAIHDLNAVYIPAFGGMFHSIDEKVNEIVRKSLGDEVKIHLVHNSITQSHSGGVHCTVSIYARENSGSKGRRRKGRMLQGKIMNNNSKTETSRREVRVK